MPSIDFFRNLQNYPEFLRTADLVSLGLFKNRCDVCRALKTGTAPPAIKMSQHRNLFPRDGLIDWLQRKMINGDRKNDSD